jgi:hypothetical protein
MRVSIVLIALAAGLFALPATAAAAGTCALTTTAAAGHSITVTGTGFTPGADVDITQTWGGSNATAGGNTGPQTTTSRVVADAAGGFEYTVDAGPGRGGTYDFSAASGGCTATAQAVAVETAGGVNHGTGGSAGGANSTPPATDTAPATTGRTSNPVWAILLVLAAASLAGVAFTLHQARATRG